MLTCLQITKSQLHEDNRCRGKTSSQDWGTQHTIYFYHNITSTDQETITIISVYYILRFDDQLALEPRMLRHRGHKSSSINVTVNL